MKMSVKQDRYDVGVIVGRFQVPELHDAHRALIQHVCDEHNKVIVFLGVSPLWSTRENPLDFEARKQMLLAEFPDINVLYIQDVNNDEAWSRRLDRQIKALVTPSQTVVLYGGRESFIDHYHGDFRTRELQQDVWVSGTEIREQISKARAKASPDWRAGAVWAAFSRFPTTYPTVDIAILSPDSDKILLGRKPHEDKFRFIGGFADPGSETYEQDARREVHEETGIGITDPVYIGSFKVDDWRYRNEVDKIKTLLFVAHHQFGAPKPNDDISELHWFPLSELSSEDVMPAHRPLLEAVQRRFTSPKI